MPVAKRQRTGVLAMIDKESETIEYLVSILLTFTSDQMAAFVAGAQEIIAQYAPERLTPCANTPGGKNP